MYQSPGWCNLSRPQAHQINDANKILNHTTHQMKKVFKTPVLNSSFFSYVSAKHFCNVSPQSFPIYSLP